MSDTEEWVVPVIETEGIPRLETVGAIVRGEYHQLVRIVEVLERTRCSPRHITSPLDVVVRCEDVGPGYGHHSSWASKLTPAQPGDVGSHPHRPGCACGKPYDSAHGPSWLWYPMPASWEQW